MSHTCHCSRSMWEHRIKSAQPLSLSPICPCCAGPMGPPTPTRTEPGREGHAGSTSEICVQGFSISGDGSLQGGRVMQLLLGGNTEVLTGPWSCPHPRHGCEPEADNGSDCGPGDSPGSWHLSSGSSTCSGPAKDRELTDEGG